MKPGLGEAVHDLRPRERLGQEDRVRVLGQDLGDQPLPEHEGLRVRVVDAEDADAVADPEAHDLEQRVPQGGPLLALELERVDVLVALGRVLGVLDRAVGAVPEPLGVLLHPGVVGRALEGEVEGDLDVVGLRRLDEMVELGEAAERGVDGGVAALGRADRPRAAEVAVARLGALFGPLRCERPIGWIGGR